MYFQTLSIFVITSAAILPLYFRVILSSASHTNKENFNHHHQPAKEQRCLDRCAKHRKHWRDGPYQLDCSQVPDTKKCEEDCLSCPEEICNNHHHSQSATITANPKGSNSVIFLCPDAPKLPHKCLERCDSTRETGNNSKYLLNCEKQFANDEHKRLSCSKDCDKCPDWICNKTENPNMFFCPSAHLEGECKERCDSKRHSKEKPYLLSCAKDYDNPEDKEECIKECGHCPPYVCTKDDFLGNNRSKVVYHCPPGPAAETTSETSWLVLSLVLGIPAFIFLIVLLWLCFYCSRHGGVLTRHNVVLHYGLQEQIPQDPYNLSLITILQPSTSEVVADGDHDHSNWAPDDDKDKNEELTSQHKINKKQK